MALTRRTALGALTSIIGALTASSARAQHTFTSSLAIRIEPMPLSFHLNAYSEYRFQLGDRVVTLTPEALMDALDTKDH